jgi:threonine dehydratase
MSKKDSGHNPDNLISISRIYDAARILKSKVLYTPLIYSSELSRVFGGQIFLKLENLQKTGSFKVRGATYKLLKNFDHIGSGGVVAASAGNHAQGVALAAHEVGMQAFIVMPLRASITKQEATRNYGGKVILHGESIGESLSLAKEMAKNGKTLIHPFDDRQIIAGQGTIGLEIVEALPDVDMVIGPVGGGGLLSGVAIAIKSLCPAAKIIGVQSKCCPSAFKALNLGNPVTIESMPSIADGINVKRMGHIPFKVLNTILDDIILVNESAIISAILMLLEQKKLLAEGAGAVSLAPLISGSVRLSSKAKVVLIISGGNIDSSILDRIIHRGLIKDARIIRLQVILDDRPGSLARLLGIIASLNANVLHIHHERNDKDMPLLTTRVNLELETRGISHIEKISKSIESKGYHIF